MKTNELMIGDWVNYVDKEHNIKRPCRITMLSNDGSWAARLPFGGEISGNEKECSIDECLEGIELTPEIFEQNGFKKDAWHSDVWEHERLKAQYIRIQTNGSSPLWGGGDQDHVYADCKYVHDLQHLLKFCKIDDLL